MGDEEENQKRDIEEEKFYKGFHGMCRITTLAPTPDTYIYSKLRNCLEYKKKNEKKKKYEKDEKYYEKNWKNVLGEMKYNNNDLVLHKEDIKNFLVASKIPELVFNSIENELVKDLGFVAEHLHEDNMEFENLMYDFLDKDEYGCIAVSDLIDKIEGSAVEVATKNSSYNSDYYFYTRDSLHVAKKITCYPIDNCFRRVCCIQVPCCWKLYLKCCHKVRSGGQNSTKKKRSKPLSKYIEDVIHIIFCNYTKKWGIVETLAGLSCFAWITLGY